MSEKLYAAMYTQAEAARLQDTLAMALSDAEPVSLSLIRCGLTLESLFRP